jgi:hypothetical protein
MTSQWVQCDVEEKVRVILRDVSSHDPAHHFGRPFLTAYQLAIAYDQKHHQDVVEMGYQVGGLGIDEPVSLAQYLARELSRRIKGGHITDIEGAFLANDHLHDIFFKRSQPGNNETIQSSLTQAKYPLSMFRIRDD